MFDANGWLIALGVLAFILLTIAWRKPKSDRRTLNRRERIGLTLMALSVLVIGYAGVVEDATLSVTLYMTAGFVFLIGASISWLWSSIVDVRRYRS